MTLKELSQLYYLNREIEMDQHRLRELEAKALSGAQVITGMPHGSGTVDKVGALVAEMADVWEMIEAKLQRCLQQQVSLEKYISGIDDSLTRQIFTYRFVEGLSWENVADKIGKGYTAVSVRQIACRYVRKN